MPEAETHPVDPHGDMLRAWAEANSLLLQACPGCGATFFYPRSRCPSCWGGRPAAIRADGYGIVVTATLVRKGLPDGLADQAPICLAEIELDEGIVIIARVLTRRLLPKGTRVVLTRAKPELSLPTFEPEASVPFDAQSETNDV